MSFSSIIIVSLLPRGSPASFIVREGFIYDVYTHVHIYTFKD